MSLFVSTVSAAFFASSSLGAAVETHQAMFSNAPLSVPVEPFNGNGAQIIQADFAEDVLKGVAAHVLRDALNIEEEPVAEQGLSSSLRPRMRPRQLHLGAVSRSPHIQTATGFSRDDALRFPLRGLAEGYIPPSFVTRYDQIGNQPSTVDGHYYYDVTLQTGEVFCGRIHPETLNSYGEQGAALDYVQPVPCHQEWTPQ